MLKTIMFCSHRTTCCLFLLSCLLFTANPVSGQDTNPFEVAGKLQKTYANAKNIVADFNQITSMKLSPRIRQGAGKLIFLKPGRMRWDYMMPDYQVLISDGETISMYFEKSNQMIISNAKDYLQSDVTYSFFAGTGDIIQDFDISSPDFENVQPNTHLIKLIPKTTHPQVSFMHAWITVGTFLIEHLRIVDHFETVTDLFFTKITIDGDFYDKRKIEDDIFTFTPPADTEIIEQF